MAAESKEKDEIKTIFFKNLQLLNMNVVDMEGSYKIPFNKDMFNLPNKAGSEVVLHFLFNRLNPSACREQFRDCWPVIDRKTELQFRKVCTNWLTSIQKDDVESHLPYVSAALLLSPGGRKFIYLLYSFSTYVLVQVMKAEHGWEAQYSITYPAMHQRTAALGVVVSSAIHDSLMREQSQFFEHLHLAMIANRQWKDYTNELVKEYRGLTKANRDLELEKRLQVSLLADKANKQGLSLPTKRAITMFDSDESTSVINRGQRIEKAKSQWVSLTKFNDRMTDKREIFQSILDNTSSKFTIDGTEMGVHVPGLLLRECSKEIHKREIDNVYNGGALNLVSLVQLWNICLNMYKEQLETETLPSVSSEVPHISAQAHKHHSHLRHTQELREKIRNHTLPKLRRSIARLQKKLNNQAASTTFADQRTNRLGLILTAPTPPSAAVTRSSVGTGETPPGPVAGPVVHSGSTPDALQNVFSKIEKAVRKDVESSQVLKDVPVLARLMNTQRRSVAKKTTSVPVSKSHLKEDHLKSAKSLDRTKAFVSKNSVQVGPGASILMHAGPQKAKQTFQNSGKPFVVSDSSTTPRTSKMRAVDVLADTVVNSVLNSADSSMLSDIGVDPLLEFGDLGFEAFETKSLIERSPAKNKSFQNLESQHEPEGARPKTFSAHQSRTNGLHSKQKSPETSIQHESVFSQNSKDADSSFDSGSGEFDWSNNAAVGEANWLPKGLRSRNGTKSSHHSFDELAKVLNVPESYSKNTSKSAKSGVAIQLLQRGSTSSEKTPRSTKKRSDEENDSALLESFSNDWHVFNLVDALDEPSVTCLESGEKQTSQDPLIAHSFVSENYSMVNSSLTSEKKNENTDVLFKFTKTPQNNDNYSQLNLLQNELTTETTLCNVAREIKSLHGRKNGVDLPDTLNRQPGDGQSSSDYTVQQVPLLVEIDSDTDIEEALDGGRPHSLSPFRTESGSLSTSDLLTAHLNSRLNNSAHQHEQCNVLSDALSAEADKDLLTAGVKLQPLQESKLVSNSHRKPLCSDILNEHFSPKIASPLIINPSEIYEEKLLDLEVQNLPTLVSLDSEDEDFESEQDLNDSYIPFKGGIHLDSMSPAKHSLTPSRLKSQPLSRSDNSKLSSQVVPILAPASEGSIQMKLALLQQKASDILDSCSDDSDEPDPSVHKKDMPTTAQCIQGDAGILYSKYDENDDDILNTEIINTDLLAGNDDLLSF